MEKNALLRSGSKQVGIALIAGSLLTVFIFKGASLIERWSFTDDERYLFKNSVMSLLNIGLFLIFYAANKHDDEMTIQLKLRSTMIAVLMGTCICFVTPLLNYLWSDPLPMSANTVIMFILLVQIGLYYNMRRQLKRELKEDEE